MELMQPFERIVTGLRFYAQAQTLHHIHAPYLFRFIEFCFDKKRLYYDFIKISNAHYKLAINAELIPDSPFARRHRQYGRTVSELHKRASANVELCELLYRIAQFTKPQHILELGSCLGVSGLSLKLGAPQASMVSIEGNSFLSGESEKLFSEYGLSRVHCMHCTVEDYLEGPELPLADLVYVDASHTYDQTKAYVHKLLAHGTRPEALIILDDIHWSSGMYRAWNEIIRWPEVQCSLETCRLGLLFTSRTLTPGAFTWIARAYKPWNIGLFH